MVGLPDRLRPTQVQPVGDDGARLHLRQPPSVPLHRHRHRRQRHRRPHPAHESVQPDVLKQLGARRLAAVLPESDVQFLNPTRADRAVVRRVRQKTRFR